MNIRQTLAMEGLRKGKKYTAAPEEEMRSRDLASWVFKNDQKRVRHVSAATADDWRDENVSSKRFVLTKIAVNKLAVPQGKAHPNDVQRMLASNTLPPIVVDMNKKKIGGMNNYRPATIVIDGLDVLEAASLRGHLYVQAWIGDLAAESLDIMADDEMSSNELQKNLQKLLTDKLKGKNPFMNNKGGIQDQSTVTIVEVYPFEYYCIYSFNDKNFRIKFDVNQSTRTVTLASAPQPVAQAWLDEPVAAAAVTRMDRALGLMGCGSNCSCGCGGGKVKAAKRKDADDSSDIEDEEI